MTVLTSLDCPMASDPDDVLKNSQPKYSYQLIYLMCLEEFCFSDYWKLLSVVSVFKNVRKYCQKTMAQEVSFLLQGELLESYK